MDDKEYLVDTYLNKEDWHGTKLSRELSEEYFDKMLKNNQVVVLRKEDKPIGYLSVWFLNNEQTANVLNGKPIDCIADDLSSGDIVYVENAYVEDGHRNENNIVELKEIMKKIHKDKDYVGVIFQDGYRKGNFSFYKKGEI